MILVYEIIYDQIREKFVANVTLGNLVYSKDYDTYKKARDDMIMLEMTLRDYN